MTKPEHFYYDNGVPRNRFGLDDNEVLGMLERDLSATRLAEIQSGEAPEATRGNFDLDHLKAIHQYTMQDTYEWAGVTRNELMTIEGRDYQAAPLLWKEGSDHPFTPSHEVNAHLNATFAEVREKNYLQGLSREDFAQEGARTFSQINQAHPFMEGNGRTQREFMRQLGEQAGHPLNFNLVDSQRMNQASEQARLGDRAELVQVFRDSTPQETQQQVFLKKLDAQGFAEVAAQRLSETVRTQEVTPEQVRQEAAQLGREAERPLNLEHITTARLTHDTAAAQQGDAQGFTRMFQEASDPNSAKLLQKAAENLEQRGIDPDRLYLTVANTGEQYAGHLEFRNSRVAVVADDQGRHLATPPTSLKGIEASEQGRVQFTASEPSRMQQQLDY